MENFKFKYFLASNSCEGFISNFSDCYSAEENYKVYIIKGGPGTGKSSFMRHIANKGLEKNLKVVVCPCSSDPNSLDAVIFPQIKTVIMDGTAPHTVDPKFPGVCEEILNFGQFWDRKKLEPFKEKIIDISYKNKQKHSCASRYFKSVGMLIFDNLSSASSITDGQKVLSFSKKFCQKHIPIKIGNPREEIRYLCGLTPNGVVAFTDTPFNETENIFIINDEFGSVCQIFMPFLREFLLKNGYSIKTIKNPFLPSFLIDGIIIPELSLSVLREYEFGQFDTGIRRIHAKRFLKSANLKTHINFNRKAIRELLTAGCDNLKEAKEIHDRLEKYYIDAMNFDALKSFTEDFAKKLFN